MITGGWEYVWASFVVTWVTLGLYGVSLFVRWRKLNAPPEAAPSPEEPKGTIDRGAA